MSPKSLPSLLAESLKAVRQAHPLPGEVLPEDERHVNDLLLPLRKLDAAEWSRYCTHFDVRLDRQIFMAFRQVEDGEGQKRLQQLCRERCSWSLYEQAWSAFLSTFPRRGIQLAFAELYATLRRDPQRYGLPPSYLGDFLPARVDFSLQADLLLQNSFLLLQEHMHELTGKGRSSVSVDAARLRAHLLAFFSAYGITYLSRFGSALLGKYLLSCEDPLLFQQRKLLSEIAERLPQDQFLQLLTRVSQSLQISEQERGPLYRILFLALERAPNGADLWLDMPKRTRQNLLRWHIWQTLQEHYAMNPRKEKVMLHFSRSISDVIELDSKTVVWRFKGFVLLDTWDEQDFSYYYPQELFEKFRKAHRAGQGFSDSEIPCRILTADNHNLAASGAVRLSFVMPQLEQTLLFLSRLTGQKAPQALA